MVNDPRGETVYVTQDILDGIEYLSSRGVNILAPGQMSEKALDFHYPEVYHYIQNNMVDYMKGAMGTFAPK
ncbi:MAG TPA: hypothetical protein VJ044_07245 [Candidatus Hodarchaeales archaeon]|nr:hypothetical protein [Candidatus Hodarchaeales archaeon]